MLHFEKIIATCPGTGITLEEGFDWAGKAGFGVLHTTQLIEHAARLLYCLERCQSLYRGI